MDAITHKIVQQLGALPLGKKKALLELLRQEHSSAINLLKTEQESWKKKQLLSASVWTDTEINALQEAREFINQWQPKPF